MFAEKELYLEIVRVWGYYGAHAEVFRALYMQAYPDTPPPEWFYRSDKTK